MNTGGLNKFYVCDAAGTGKSRMLENLIRQDIRNWYKSKCGAKRIGPSATTSSGRALLATLPSILTMVWLTTFGEVMADPFGPIWIRPSEYREATTGTPFDPERQTNSFVYRRNTAREVLVESKIKKLRLLG